MAYQNISFPLPLLIHDLKVEPMLPTNIVSNYQKEYRLNRFLRGSLHPSYYPCPQRGLYDYWSSRPVKVAWVVPNPGCG